MSNQEERNRRRSLVGEVISRSGDKTIKVVYGYKTPHPLYKKEIKRRTIIHVHDEKNECGLGDKVQITETRPLSKSKRFRVVKIITKAPLVGA